MQSVSWIPYRELHPESERQVPGDLRVTRCSGTALIPARDIFVHAPPEASEGSRRFPAVYMQDGLSLFDPATSLAGSWRLGQTMQALHREGIDAIIVGIPNAERRRPTEYTPWPSADPDDGVHGPTGGGDAYVRFVVDVVKPLVDASYPTLPGPGTTGVMGSSLGGLISLYAFFARPDVFGFVGAMSPGIPDSQMGIVELIRLGRVPLGRVYLDVGGREGEAVPGPEGGQALSAAFLDGVRRLHRLLISIGYRDGEDLRFVSDEQAVHDEGAWAARLPGALRLLLTP